MGDASTQIPCMIRLFFALTKCDIKYFGGITLFWTCIDLFFPKMWPLTRKRSERIAVLKLIAVHLPFERTGMLFECLELSVLKNSSSVRTVRAIRLRKLISCSNGSSYPFKKIISRSNGSSYPFKKFISHLNGSSYPFQKFAAIPTRQDFKTIRHSLFNNACRYVYVTQTVVTFLFFVYLRLIWSKIISFSQLFPGKKFKKTPLVMVFH